MSESFLNSSYPKRAFIQCFSEGVPAGDYKHVIETLQNKQKKNKEYKVEIILETSIHRIFSSSSSHYQQPIDPREDFICGNFEWTRFVVQRYKLKQPEAPDYPSCLRHLLYRPVGESTLGEMAKKIQQRLQEYAQEEQKEEKQEKEQKNEIFFIKPRHDAKSFSGIIEPKDAMIDALMFGIPDVMPAVPEGPNAKVYYSEIREMLFEYRVYVVHSEIRSICLYLSKDSSKAKNPIPLNEQVVKEAVKTFCESPEGEDAKFGCSLDFCVMRLPVEKKESEEKSEKEKEKEDENDGDGKLVTALIEVNLGLSLGKYDDVSAEDYTELLCARYKRLVEPAIGSSSPSSSST